MRISGWSSDVCSSDLYSREAHSEYGKFAALGAPTSASDFWQLGFDASWELDLWGRARRSREGASAAFEVTVYEREARSEEHTSELQSPMRLSYAVFCLIKTKN